MSLWNTWTPRVIAKKSSIISDMLISRRYFTRNSQFFQKYIANISSLCKQNLTSKTLPVSPLLYQTQSSFSTANISSEINTKNDHPHDNTQAQQQVLNTTRSKCIVMEGHSLADDILDEVKYRTREVIRQTGRPPRLAVLFVGERADSHKYIRVKTKTAQSVGIATVIEHLPKASTLEEVLNKINNMNIDSSIDGIIIQLPLPSHINAQIALQTVTPTKDVDGFHLHNQANLLDSDYVNTCAFTFTNQPSQKSISSIINNSNNDDLHLPISQSTTNIEQAKIIQTSPDALLLNVSAASSQEHTDRVNWDVLRPGSSTDSLPGTQSSSFPSISSNLAVSFKGAPGFLVGTTGQDFTHSGQASPLFPCTPLACIALLDRYNIPLPGAHVVVLGRSTVVGFPLSMMLMHRGAVVSNLDSHARKDSVELLCRSADVIVTAVGSANLVTPDLIKPGAVILDVGINFVDLNSENSNIKQKSLDKDGKSSFSKFIADSIPKRRYDCTDTPSTASSTPVISTMTTTNLPKKLVGDVDFEACFEKAGMITPVPGGIGPITVAMLLRNLVSTCEHDLVHGSAIKK